MKHRILFRLIIILNIIFVFNCLAKDAAYYSKEGQKQYESGNYEKALELFQKYADKAPDNWHPYNRLAWTYYNLQKYNDAIQHFMKSNRQEEKWGNYQGLGWSHYRLGKYNDAIENLKKANRMEEQWNLYQWLTYAYVALDNFDLALQNALKWAQLKPDDWRSHNQLGNACYNLQRHNDAVEHYKKANNIKVNGSNYAGLGRNYLAMDRYEDAIHAVMTGMNLMDSESDQSQLQFILAYIYVAQGRYKEAYKILGDLSTLGVEIKRVAGGIRINNALKGGPADVSGLTEEDIIVVFNGQDVTSLSATTDFIEMIKNTPFGSKVWIKINRQGILQDKWVVVGIPENLQEIAQSDERLKSQREEIEDKENTGKTNVAVIDLDAFGIPEEEALVLTDRLRFELFKTNRYVVLERDKMKAIFDELGFQQTGHSTDEYLVELGKMLNVQNIIGGSIGKVGSYYTASLRMIDIETGKILAVATEDIEGSIDDFLIRGIKNITYKLLKQ